MLFQLLVERGQDEQTVNLAGRPYVFKRNKAGAMVADITDQSTIGWVSRPNNPSFKPYAIPEKNIIDESTDEALLTEEDLPDHEQTGDDGWPPLIKKGGKRSFREKK